MHHFLITQHTERHHDHMGLRLFGQDTVALFDLSPTDHVFLRTIAIIT